MSESQAKSPIIFAGGIYRDLVAYAERFPKVGETLIGTKFKMGFGGKSANQAVMCSRLGGNSLILGMVGNDDNGKAYIDNFKANNIVTTLLGVVNNDSSGVASIVVETSTGHNEIVIIPGANQHLTPEIIENKESALKEASAVVVGLEVPIEAIIRVLEIARRNGVMTITNAAPGKSDLDPRIFEFTDVLCVNETEAEMIVGRSEPMVTDDDIAEVAKALLKKCATVIMTLGERGSVFITRHHPEVVQVPADFVDHVVDTTGAGDAFVGALAFYLVEMRHLQLREVVRRSGIIATMSVQAEGTQTSFPYKKDLNNSLFE